MTLLVSGSCQYLRTNISSSGTAAVVFLRPLLTYIHDSCQSLLSTLPSAVSPYKKWFYLTTGWWDVQRGSNQEWNVWLQWVHQNSEAWSQGEGWTVNTEEWSQSTEANTEQFLIQFYQPTVSLIMAFCTFLHILYLLLY